MLEERQVRIGIQTAETGVLLSLILLDLFSFFDWAVASSRGDWRCLRTVISQILQVFPEKKSLLVTYPMCLKFKVGSVRKTDRHSIIPEMSIEFKYTTIG